jgi:hypothetical protein
MPSAPKFKFELREEAIKHNLAVLEKYDCSSEQALNAQRDSPLGPGKEFGPPDILRSVFGLHPLWNRMEDILSNGSKWLLADISEESRASDLQTSYLQIALTCGNHKAASKKPNLLMELIGKDVKYGYSVPIPLESDGADEHHGTKHDQQIWEGHPKRQTHPRSDLEVGLGHVRQQQSPRRAPARVQIQLLHLSHRELGSGSTESISW